jgi:hypothetical protein
MLPPAGVTVGVRGATYSASELRDTHGDVTPVGIKLNVNSAAFAVVKTTYVAMLGGTYAFAAVVPYLDMDNRLTLPKPFSRQPPWLGLPVR